MAAETIGDKIVAAVDKSWANRQDDGFRSHLGASICGNACARAVWYHFRWAYQKRHLGRLLRLFNRGHMEEPRMTQWLRDIGALVEDADPETKEQFWISDFNGHFGGSADGKISDLERFGLNGKGLLEFKTHGDKSFKSLKDKGVVTAKLVHFIQMQIYMHYLGLPWALYVAVNKNTDELHMEVIHYKEEVAAHYARRAGEIIEQQVAPPKINESASWWVCKFCDYRHVCHEGQELAHNCRSCINAKPVLDSEAAEAGAWYCDRWRSFIPKEYLRKGCNDWEPLGQ